MSALLLVLRLVLVLINGLFVAADAWMGWRRVIRGGIDLFEVPGGHLTLLSEPNVRVLAQQLQDCLNCLT